VLRGASDELGVAVGLVAAGALASGLFVAGALLSALVAAGVLELGEGTAAAVGPAVDDAASPSWLVPGSALSEIDASGLCGAAPIVSPPSRVIVRSSDASPTSATTTRAGSSFRLNDGSIWIVDDVSVADGAAAVSTRWGSPPPLPEESTTTRVSVNPAVKATPSAAIPEAGDIAEESPLTTCPPKSLFVCNGHWAGSQPKRNISHRGFVALRMVAEEVVGVAVYRSTWR
jgi:hypothetical protein